MTVGEQSMDLRKHGVTQEGRRGFGARHPLMLFIGLAYLLSWACWVPLALGAGSVTPGSGWPTHLPGLMGPALAAVIVTALVSGGRGLIDLWHRVVRWRVGWWWLSVVVILAAGAGAIVIGGGVQGSGDLWHYNGVSAPLGPVVTILTVLVMNGIGEEAGWRGFLADRLLAGHSLTTTSLLVAAVWAPWHLPMFFLVDSFESFTIASIAGWVVGLTAGSFVLTWLYRGSGSSILLVAVWHCAFNFASATPGANGAAAAVTSTLVMVAAVVIAVADHRSRSRAPEPLSGATGPVAAVDREG
jgi:CAAX protease family protein